jgi:hypothetical protein
VIKTIDAVCQPVPGEPDSVTALRFDMAAYAYYCATLEDTFTEPPGSEGRGPRPRNRGLPGDQHGLAGWMRLPGALEADYGAVLNFGVSFRANSAPDDTPKGRAHPFRAHWRSAAGLSRLAWHLRLPAPSPG